MVNKYLEKIAGMLSSDTKDTIKTFGKNVVSYGAGALVGGLAGGRLGASKLGRKFMSGGTKINKGISKLTGGGFPTSHGIGKTIGAVAGGEAADFATTHHSISEIKRKNGIK